ncbi:MAG: hypothetical protein ABFD64_04590 [Armatimonadota bacterium]
MAAVKRTYALPEETVREFEQAVTPGRRSTVLNKVMKDWLGEQKRMKLREQVAEGCREMWDVWLESEKEWHPLEEEAARKHDEGA